MLDHFLYRRSNYIPETAFGKFKYLVALLPDNSEPEDSASTTAIAASFISYPSYNFLLRKLQEWDLVKDEYIEALRPTHFFNNPLRVTLVMMSSFLEDSTILPLAITTFTKLASLSSIRHILLCSPQGIRSPTGLADIISAFILIS